MPTNLIPKSFEYNLIDILGEQVSFTKSGLFPGETAIVDFDIYYRPTGLSDDDFSTLKRTMRIVFENRTKDLVDTESGEPLNEKTTVPFPPCGQKEKSLVLASLLHRASLLRQQLYELGVLTPEQLKKKIEEIVPGKNKPIQGEENLLARQHLLHLYTLQKFIDDYDEQQQCIHISDIAYKNSKLDLDDDKIKELLKQFVFFILQSQNPQENYKDVEPDAPKVIASLEKNPLKEKFSPFLNTYKQSGSPFPPSIAKVLESMDGPPKALADEVKRQVEAEKQEILKRIYLIIPQKDPFWTRIQDPTDISTIIETLRKQNEEWDDDVNHLEARLAQADQKIQACQKANAALEARKKEMTTRIAELEQQLQASSAGDVQKAAKIEELEALKKTADEDFQRRSEVLQKTIEDCTAEKATLQDRINELETQKNNLNAELATLRQRVQELEAIKTQSEQDVTQLQRQHQEALAKAREEVAGAEAARSAAEASATATRNELAQKETELATTRLALDAEKQTAQAATTRINELERQMREEEEATQKIRQDLSAKTAEVESSLKQLRECEAKSQEISDALQVKTQELAKKSSDAALIEQELEGANAEIDQLTRDFQAEEAKVRDLQIALDACKAEKKTLEQSASGGDREVGRLRGELTAAQGQLQQAESTINQLTGTLKTLEAQLQQEKEKSSSLETTIGEQIGALQSQQSQIQGLQGTLQQTQGQLETMTTKAKEAEAKVGELDAKVKQVSEDSQKQLTGNVAAVQQKCSEELQKTKQSFEQRLQREKAELEQRLKNASSQQLEQERANYQAQLEAQKQELEGRIQSALDTSQQEATTLAAEKQELEKKLREVTLANEQQKAALLQQKNECETKLNQMKTAYQSELTELQRQRDDCQRRLAILSSSSVQERNELQRVLNEEKAALEKRLQEVANASATKADEITRQKAELEKKVEQTQQASSAQQAKLEAEKQELQRKLDEANAQQTKLQADKQELQRRVEEVSTTAAQIEDLTQQKNKLTDDLKRATNSARVSSSQTSLLTRQKAETEAKLQDVVNKHKAEITKQKTDCDARITEIQGSFEEERARLENRVIQLQEGIVQLANESDGKVQELEAKLQICETRAAEQAAAYEAEIQRLKDEHEAKLQMLEQNLQIIIDESKKLDTLSEGRLQQIEEQTKRSQELLREKGQYEKVVQLLKEISRQIDAGPAMSVQVDASLPGANSLSAIISRLSTPVSSKVSMDAAKEKPEYTMNLCYTIFLASFLWQMNFPSLSSTLIASDALGMRTHQANVFVQTFMPNLYNGGDTPQAPKWAEPSTVTTSNETTKKPTHSFKPGFYQYEKTQHGSFEQTVMRELLHIFHIIGLAMEATDAQATEILKKLSTRDIKILDELTGKINEFINDYSSVYKAPDFDLKKQFANLLSEVLKSHQPLPNTSILNRFLVKETSGAGQTQYKIVTKGTAEDPSKINYAFIFYSFLVVVRDLLNHIGNTVEKQCPLPGVLVKKQAKK